jgi:polyhydroxyalkanoate synthesis repressor PhaR
MATIIKRYPNRKLYNTETKRYITLDNIATLIRAGEEVRVVDHATDEDLTTLTLTQIIFEQEKKSGGFLPRTVLTGLIQAGGQTMDTLRRTLEIPLQLWGTVESEIERRLQELINRGELAREEGARLGEKLLGSKWRGLPLPTADTLDDLLHLRNLPTTDDLRGLFDQLDVVTSRINALLHSHEGKSADFPPATPSPDDDPAL